MGFKYMDTLATPENVDKLLTLINRVAGATIETKNVFDEASGSINEWCSELGIVPVTSGQWSGYSHPLLQETIS